MELTRLLREIQEESKELTSEMPFSAYLPKVLQDKRLARLSHQLVHDMILAAGVSKDRTGRARYNLFRNELFGVDDVIAQVVEYFAAAARRHEVRKRILLLIGPPGCGKSTLVNAIKQGLEDYTRTPAGAVYAIKGCPVQEDPLHLVPRHRRKELRGLRIEGDLCPYCRWLVRNVYRGDIARVPVQRITFSTGEGVGIGTFVATDPGSEDLTRLVGSVDLTLLRGSTDRAAARHAYRLDGELNAANRGLVDLIEILKMDERFLAVLLTLSQEQMIKLGGRGTMYADEAIVAHSNLAEYDAVVADPKAAALLDRLVVVRMGYALSVRDEIRIYQKMLGQAGIRVSRMSPIALPLAATFAVLTRLRPQPGWSLERKLHFFDGRFVADLRPEEVEALRSGNADDGMSGFSPRYVINQLSRAFARPDGCITGAKVVEVLWEGLSQRAGFGEAQREQAAELFAVLRREYDEMTKRAVRRAMVPGFEQAAAAYARGVLEELEAHASGRGKDLEKTKRIEELLGIGAYGRDDFRTDLLSRLREAGKDENLAHVDGRLEEGIERALLPRWDDAARQLLAYRREPRSRGLERLRKTLVEEGGFPEGCVDEVLTHATDLAVPELERRGPRVLRWRG